MYTLYIVFFSTYITHNNKFTTQESSALTFAKGTAACAHYKVSEKAKVYMIKISDVDERKIEMIPVVCQ